MLFPYLPSRCSLAFRFQSSSFYLSVLPLPVNINTTYVVSLYLVKIQTLMNIMMQTCIVLFPICELDTLKMEPAELKKNSGQGTDPRNIILASTIGVHKIYRFSSPKLSEELFFLTFLEKFNEALSRKWHISKKKN